MRVLMFGWEFPPHIAGGLGTACYGMTRGLARNDVNVTFVMPRATGDEDQNYVRVVNASDVETLFGAASGDTEELWKKMSFIHIDSNMVPYVSPEEYKSYHDEYAAFSVRKTPAYKLYYCASRAFSDAQQSVVCLTTSSHVIFPCAYSRR